MEEILAGLFVTIVGGVVVYWLSMHIRLHSVKIPIPTLPRIHVERERGTFRNKKWLINVDTSNMDFTISPTPFMVLFGRWGKVLKGEESVNLNYSYGFLGMNSSFSTLRGGKWKYDKSKISFELEFGYSHYVLHFSGDVNIDKETLSGQYYYNGKKGSWTARPL